MLWGIGYDFCEFFQLAPLKRSKKIMTSCFFNVNGVAIYDRISHRGEALAASRLAWRVAEVPPLGPRGVGPSPSGL